MLLFIIICTIIHNNQITIINLRDVCQLQIKESVQKLWKLPLLFHPRNNLLRGDEAFVFVDNHDSQRGHSSDNVYTFKQPRRYQMAQGEMYAR